MRSVAIAALSLCALLGFGLALSTPSNSPEDYTFTYRNPSGCTLAGDDCDYFVGIQLNQGSRDYLDFYLVGAAAGWVAIGFSQTPSMFDADVLGCIVIGTDAGAVDTWNVASPGRANELDSTQVDIIEYEASITNGRITCSFSRLIAITNVGQDLNLLAENYWLLYGVSQNVISTGTLPIPFDSHVPNTPMISNAVVNLGIVVPTAPITPPEDYPFTYREPGDCTLAGGNCNYFVAIQYNEANPNYLDFYLVGVAETWVAIGFSTTADMFDADVLGCIRVGSNVYVIDTWNVASPGRVNVLDDNQNDLYVHEASFENGIMTDSFTRLIAVTNVGQDLDLLAEDYWLLYGTSQNLIAPPRKRGNGVVPFNTHVPAIPTISDDVVPLKRRLTLPPNPTVPTNPPEDYTFTYREPDGCVLGDNSNCTYFVGIQVNEGNPYYLDFYLEGVAEAWVAIGFSTTANMFDADVLGCVRIDPNVRAVDTWNVASPGRDNVLDDTQNDIIENEASFTNGRITCDFTRKAAGVNEGQDLDLLAENYWLLYGTGQNVITGSLPQAFNTHIPAIPTISTTVMNITMSTAGGQAVQAHGLLMIITMSVIAVTAAFFAV